jgi:hypothetical protein
VSAARRTPALPIAALLWLALAAGCAAPRGPVVATPLDAGDPRARGWLEAIQADAVARRGLRGVAKLALDGPGGSGRVKEVFACERPARLRVETLGLLDQTLALLVTDGARYRLVRSADRSVEEGAVHEALLLEMAGVAVTPEEVVAILLGAPGAAEARVVELAALSDGGLRVVRARAPGGARESADYDADLRLRSWTLGDAAGLPVLAARFDEHRPLGGVAFAHAIALLDLQSGAEARIEFQSVELNPALPPGLFAW